MKRYFYALLIGVSISLALFWLMQYMVLNNQQGFKHTEPLGMLEFVRLKRENKVETKSRKRPPPPPPKKRPQPPPLQNTQPQLVQNVPAIEMPKLNLPLQNKLNNSLLSGVQPGVVTENPGLGLGSLDAELVPLFLVQPRYPMRAKSRRIEGWVKVQFTVTKKGTVENAIILQAEPKNIFDRSALRAIAKWKFKPRRINGKAVAFSATKKLIFKLTK